MVYFQRIVLKRLLTISVTIALAEQGLSKEKLIFK